jgi:hypothetical protein
MTPAEASSLLQHVPQRELHDLLFELRHKPPEKHSQVGDMAKDIMVADLGLDPPTAERMLEAFLVLLRLPLAGNG